MQDYIKTVKAAQWQPGAAIEGVTTNAEEVTTASVKEEMQAAEPGTLAAVKTPYGWKTVKAGSFVIKHANGDYSVASEDNFNENYQPVAPTTENTLPNPSPYR